ncbi:CUL9 [Acrasis kona]|uniref:CUL9 n=1 Tax=Acrasis kona TaxID=1008807 RepID=A0AAW2Z3R1_9EUKA
MYCDEKKDKEKEDEISKHRTRICDELNLKCPGCSASFFDFDGCMALTCASCQVCFCGFCLLNCGADAHPHVQICSLNQSKSYFAPFSVFEQVQQVRRGEKIIQYLKQISNVEVRIEVLKACERDLKDLNIVIDQREVQAC